MAVKIISVVETRPGLMKTAAICDAIEAFSRDHTHGAIKHVLVHTGRSQDARGSGLYFNDLNLPKPDQFLGVDPSSSPLAKSAAITERFAELLLHERPNLVLVTGDVDSGLDCALATKRFGWCVGPGAGFAPALAHVEAGLRRFDRRLLPEVNCIVTDLLADYLFISEESAYLNLLQEGVCQNNIHFVGSVTVDTLVRNRTTGGRVSSIVNDLQLRNEGGIRPYALITLQHMFENDNNENLARLLETFFEIAQHMPVMFPAPPAALQYIHKAGLADYFIDHFLDGPEPWDARVRIRLTPPLGYLDFVPLMKEAKVVFTDSNAVQEETRFLGVPCITLAEHTSRPVTLEGGANVLAGTDPERIMGAFFKATRGEFVRPETPRGWDGLAARRIVDILWRDFAGSETRKVIQEGVLS